VTDTRFLNVVSLNLRILVPLRPIAAAILDLKMGISGKERIANEAATV
jgi:hypothetical protein